jgi:hypothetical protein
VTRIVIVVERNGDWLSYAGGRRFIQPVAGLNVVLGTRGAGATGRAFAEWRGTQTLKKIIRRTVLLDDHDDVLKIRDLGVTEYRATETQQK